MPEARLTEINKNKTLVKDKVDLTPKKFFRLDIKSDFIECLKAVLGENTQQELLELYHYAFENKNKELYNFLETKTNAITQQNNNITFVFQEVANGNTPEAVQQADSTAKVGS